MNTDTIVRCALGISERALSDFRSDGLRAKERDRLRAHVAQCPACQARLDAFETVARLLSDQPDLTGHAQLWRSVRASIAASEATPARSSARPVRHARGSVAGSSRRSARFWTALGSIAAIVALSAGFIALFVSRGGWPPATRATSTPITIHSGSLTWQQVTVPKGFPRANQPNDTATSVALTNAQSDGSVGYACQADRNVVQSPVVWGTHDAGASWSVITPGDLPKNVGGCRIVLDANAANTLVVSFYPVRSNGHIGLPDTWVTYATFDGGATWSKPAGLQRGNVTMRQASARGRVYAIRGIADAKGTVNTALYVSGDQMRTWTRIDANLPEWRTNPSQAGNTGIIFQMWANGSTDEVVLETTFNTLWSTMDDGAHWTKLAFPDQLFIGSDTPIFIVGTPTTSAHLTICGVFNSTQLYCTTDDGKTWRERPQTNVPSPALIVPSLFPVSLGADGSIYAVGNWSVSNQTQAVYRLPPGATKISDWQRLGAIPYSDGGAGYGLYPSASGMVFWTFPTYGTSTDRAGNTTTTNQPNYYVATYP
jgi:putative zinc finger protein